MEKGIEEPRRVPFLAGAVAALFPPAGFWACSTANVGGSQPLRGNVLPQNDARMIREASSGGGMAEEGREGAGPKPRSRQIAADFSIVGARDVLDRMPLREGEPWTENVAMRIGSGGFLEAPRESDLEMDKLSLEYIHSLPTGAPVSAPSSNPVGIAIVPSPLPNATSWMGVDALGKPP